MHTHDSVAYCARFFLLSVYGHRVQQLSYWSSTSPLRLPTTEYGMSLTVQSWTRACALSITLCKAKMYLIPNRKGKASSLTILNSGALQPRKWQLTGNDCSTAAQAVAAQSPR